MAGFVLGLVLMGWGHADVVQALWQTEDAVADLRSKLQLLQTSAGTVKVRPEGEKHLPASLALLPTQGQQALVWPRLQQMLASHHVRLLSLRPVPDPVAAPMPSQAVALHLQARFEDWVEAWSAMTASGPVWSIERMRITPRDAGVDLEAVLRVWMSDVTAGGGDSQGWAGAQVVRGGWPASVRAAPGRAEADSVFVHPSTVGVRSPPQSAQPIQAAAAPIDAVLQADPRHWPMSHLRLAGIWQDAQERQVILLAGPHWVRAQTGQRVTREGHTVEGIDADKVRLRAVNGTVEILTFAKVPP